MPRLRRGYSAEKSRGATVSWLFRGGNAAATWAFGRDPVRRRGAHLDKLREIIRASSCSRAPCPTRREGCPRRTGRRRAPRSRARAWRGRPASAGPRPRGTRRWMPTSSPTPASTGSRRRDGGRVAAVASTVADAAARRGPVESAHEAAVHGVGDALHYLTQHDEGEDAHARRSHGGVRREAADDRLSIQESDDRERRRAEEARAHAESDEAPRAPPPVFVQDRAAGVELSRQKRLRRDRRGLAELRRRDS